MAVGRCVFLSAVAAPTMAQIDADHEIPLTAYHLNPLEAGVIPVNMDTGDELGDLNFYLDQFLLPLECADPNPSHTAQFDCDNPERFGQTVITKVEMMVDSRFTTYSACNLCNGTDPFGNHTPCEIGTYVCDCFSHHHSSNSSGCDPKFVGAESRGKQLESAGWPWPTYCGKTDYECWSRNIPKKIGGMWYSTLEEGMCKPDSPKGSCSWKVLSASTVNETCLKNSIADAVEAENEVCFTSINNGVRNMSSPEWIGCFFDTLLGPEARNSTKVTGIDADIVVKGWKKPFLPESEGGCPKISTAQWSVLV